MRAVNDFGMDAELAAKRNANYDKGLEERTQQWIETVTQITADKEFGPWLKDGTVLCALVNALIPGRIKKVNQPGALFKEQENITAFVRVCREIGVNEASLFPTESLAQQKDLMQVLVCISQFSTTIQRKRADLGIIYDGPMLGPAVAEATGGGKPRKKWVVKPGGSSGMTMLMAGSAGTMEKTKYNEAREGIKTGKIDGLGSGKGVSALNQGSSGMEKTVYANSRNDIVTGKIDGVGTKGATTALAAGSSATMEATKYQNSRDAIKQGQIDGLGTGKGVSALNQGSIGMEKTVYANSRNDIVTGKIDGEGTKGATTAMAAGSSATMEATKFADSREAIKRGQLDGAGDKNATSILNAGSSATMQKTTHSDAREAIKEGKL